MANEFYLPLVSDVGIRRDGTLFDSSMHNAGSWMRSYRSRPQKIGGWQLIANGNYDIPRTLYNYDSDGFSYIYIGRSSSISFLQVFPDLVASAESSTTPLNFLANPQNNFIFDSVTYIQSEGEDDVQVVYVVCAYAPNLTDVGNTVERPVLYNVLGANTPFQEMINSETGNSMTTSGGVVVVSKFVIIYGRGGVIRWNDGSDFETWPSENFVQMGTSKFIAAAPTRSGNTASALFWSLNSVVIGSINDAGTGFNFAYVSTRTTLLSSKCVASFDPCFYWVGNDSFWQYNGAVQELPNEVNKKWFFDNINPNCKGKTYAYVNTQWNEFWVVFCKGTSTEPNWAIFCNLQTGSWSDTDQIDRGAAIPSGSIVPYPIMTSSKGVQYGGNIIYPMYVHEIGTDQVQFGVTSPIVASIESRYFNLWKDNPAAKVLEIDSVIFDIQQSGNMYFYIRYLGYPNSVVRQSDNFDFVNTDEFKTVRIKGSIFSITFVSNVIGGNFVMGNTMLLMNATDDQRPGPTT